MAPEHVHQVNVVMNVLLIILNLVNVCRFVQLVLAKIPVLLVKMRAKEKLLTVDVSVKMEPETNITIIKPMKALIILNAFLVRKLKKLVKLKKQDHMP